MSKGNRMIDYTDKSTAAKIPATFDRHNRLLESFTKLQEVQEYYKLGQQALEQGLGVSICHLGCGICCRVNVPIAMGVEARNIISWALGRGPLFLEGLLDRCENWLISADGPTHAREGIIVGIIPRKILGEFQTLQGSQCPFLNPDTTCVIHGARPIVCQAFGVTRDPAPICPRPLGSGERRDLMAIISGPSVDALRRKVQLMRQAASEGNPAWGASGLLPTMLLAAGRPERLKALIAENRIPSAKLLMVAGEYHGLLWQDQLDGARQGVPGELLIEHDKGLETDGIDRRDLERAKQEFRQLV